ncbi:MAG: cache domain-containing protein [Spirochaetales bacterium]|nr:cache domain-containing protein [Spirochaetales bacterium]
MKRIAFISKPLLFSLGIIVIYWIMIALLYINIRDVKREKANQISIEFQKFLDPIIERSKELTEDSFIQNWLQNEKSNKVQTVTLREYLEKKKSFINCEGIDLASTSTEIVYQDEGTKIQMSPGVDRDAWYYNFMDSDHRSNYEFYYDSQTGVLYIYHNLKLYTPSQKVVGVIGVRIRYDNITTLLESQNKAGLVAYFIDSKGEITIHPDQTKIGSMDIYDFFGLLQKEEGEEHSGVQQLDHHDGYRYSFDNFPDYLVVTKAETGHFYSRFNLANLIMLNVLLLLTGNIIIYFFRKAQHRKREGKSV